MKTSINDRINPRGINPHNPVLRIGGYIRDAKRDRYGVITQLTEEGGFFARPAELPYTADAAGLVPGAPDGAKVITATHWSPVGNGRWSGIWADAPLNAWTEVYLVNPGAAALGSIRTPKKAASSRANGAKGGRPVTSVEDCFCAGRRGFGSARGYYADGRFRVSAREAARLVRVWELGTPENLSEVYVLDDSGRRVPVWTR